jgi:hypothetical protein
MMSEYDMMLVTLFTLTGSQHTGHQELGTYAHMLAFSVYV